MSLRLLSYGDRAVLAEVDELDQVLALHEELEATRPDGVLDVVPAARSLAVVVDPHRMPLQSARAWVAAAFDRLRHPVHGAPLQVAHAAQTGAHRHGTARAVTIDVDYDGEDLPEVASILGLTVDEVVDLHTGTPWRVAFGGFALGFGYLVTDHDRLIVPRRDEARAVVPAGSVGLAGEFSGVYPRSGPGGWQLIGTTDAPLWDPNRDPAALLSPGTTVTFRRRS
ncbi:5-oxoprolinase subunit B family protein [Rathayibacter soli]|uniref:5-oxoprolinase subunit B family protein n=1 Tax=Rathayibacter soli TaxID=3144168 RepID=UPI0027E43D6C|nr:allophanate hydrolase subunit 1 [Glaciibacter superstes]